MLSPPSSIFPLSLHDALPISVAILKFPGSMGSPPDSVACSSARGSSPAQRQSSPSTAAASVTRHHLHLHVGRARDRKSTRLNSSHTVISYAVCCLEKKNTDRD